nr:hypothetical protein [Tanacetum cinerariifolium]
MRDLHMEYTKYHKFELTEVLGTNLVKGKGKPEKDVTFNEKATRNWLDLPSDIMINILQRINVFVILQSVRKQICKNLVDKSQGQLVDITMNGFCDDKLLQYVAERSSQLRRLKIGFKNNAFYNLSEALKKFPLLEELGLDIQIQEEAIQTLGRDCPMLKTLKLSKQSGFKDDTLGLAIADNLPGLRHLQLIWCKLTDTGLRAILDRCHHLQVLDLQMCGHVDLRGELGQRPACEDSPIEALATSPPETMKPTREYQNRIIQSDDTPQQIAWTHEEEITLCKGWVDVSKNNMLGNSCKEAGFWCACLAYMESKTKQYGHRTYDMVNGKWKTVPSDVVRSCGVYGNVMPRDKARYAPKNKGLRGSRASRSSSMNDEALIRLMVTEMTSHEDIRFHLQPYDHLIGDSRLAMEELKVEIKWVLIKIHQKASKKMGVMGKFEWMNTCSKKQCRSLFWRMKAAMKKAVKNKHTFLVALYGGGTKKQFNFQYDPSSYALNFDDGTHDHHDHFLHVVEPHEEITKLPLKKQHESHSSSTTTTTTTWVYVIWVGSF